ncbi:MAG: 50S ribosomal protein L22 [Thermoguttaceae bacterium]|nr:50S ribosomal protein L22 [Thermoguttaceae bacterium]
MQEKTEDKVPQYRAIHKFASISAQKVRVFVDLIRGKYADEAMTLLECYPNRGARMLEKVLKSAMHNAEDLRAQNVDQLVVAEVRIDEGPMQRRWRAGSRGVSYVIKLRSSHISVVLR